MPDKEGSDDEKKSAKSVVNKKQKQFMNQEDYIPEQEDSSMNVQKKKSTSELRREIEQRIVDRAKKRDDKRRSDAIQAKSTFNQAAEYATKQRPKIGGGERPDLKSKGGSASTGESDIKIGGPKKDPKSAGGKPKGNAPVKVDTKKKPDLSKFFGDEYIPEEGYDIARDMGRVRPSKDKKDATTMPVSKEMRKTQKVNKGPSAFERVKAKYGKSVMNIGKKKVKEELDLTKVAEAFGGYIIEAPINQRTGRKKIKKKFANQNANQNTNQNNEKPNDEKPKITGDTDAKDSGETVDYGKPSSPKVTTGKEPEKKKFKSFMKSPEFYKKDREKVIQKRKEYGIDPEGKTASDAGIERYATKTKQLASGSNVPVKITQADKDLAKKRMLGDPEDPTTGTGKYGGRVSPKASEKEMKQIKAYLKKRGLKTNFIGDKDPDKVSYNTKDRVTVNTSDTDKVATPKPKPSKLSMVGKALKKSPVTPLIAYDIGKGIFSKIMNLRGPAIRGGRAGFRSAGGNVAT